MPLATDKFGRTMSQFRASPNDAVFRAEIFPVLDACDGERSNVLG